MAVHVIGVSHNKISTAYLCHSLYSSGYANKQMLKRTYL